MLNALRHQRFVHNPFQLTFNASQRVLNALRHQRFVHTILIDIGYQLSGCSTPYGIRGLSTTGVSLLTRHSRCAQRLTASEVCPQGLRFNLSHSSFMCSTPYGIRGLSTLDYLGGWLSGSGCSTPYGIRGLSTLNRPQGYSQNSLCSTPYGIRGLSTCLVVRSSSKAVCAQRLTASEVCPHLKGDRVVVSASVLNALRHQRFVHFSVWLCL